MRSSKKNVIVRGLAVLAATALLLVGCNNSSPTEPTKLGATPAPTWTGTYNGISTQCDSSAQLAWQKADSDTGTMTVPCLGGTVLFFGGFQGNTFTGTAMWGDPELYPLKGTLTGSSLEITIFNDVDSNLSGTAMGQMHLHR